MLPPMPKTCTTVVDAKDVHDKGNSDTSSFGSQKSLAFTIAWMRSVLRRPNTALKWTATENMWVEAGTERSWSLDLGASPIPRSL